MHRAPIFGSVNFVLLLLPPLWVASPLSTQVGYLVNIPGMYIAAYPFPPTYPHLLLHFVGISSLGLFCRMVIFRCENAN
ncbi:hypothetical protein HOY82DRAFT_552651 [Tuber indicum]|nr:hypothetical protein HOY82DRAFT_552651 [Tuber indicum]